MGGFGVWQYREVEERLREAGQEAKGDRGFTRTESRSRTKKMVWHLSTETKKLTGYGFARPVSWWPSEPKLVQKGEPTTKRHSQSGCAMHSPVRAFRFDWRLGRLGASSFPSCSLVSTCVPGCIPSCSFPNEQHPPPVRHAKKHRVSHDLRVISTDMLTTLRTV
jgi:hypothetical protein